MSDLLLHYHWLASAEGAAELAHATALRAEGASDLRIGERLRQRLDADRAALVLTQLDLRERAAAKFARANEMLFTRAGYEQMTSDPIARYRARRFTGSHRIIELCCGIGGDLIALAGLGVPVLAVDLDPVHLFLAEHNARVFYPDADITPICADVRDVEIAPGDTVFIDPARREGTGKRTGYQSEPPVDWSLALADRTAGVAIKTAPGIPQELVPAVWERELIALGSDLKEAVLWGPTLATASTRATVVTASGPITLSPIVGESVPVREVHTGDWLHDVNPAVTNAGLVEDLARNANAGRIDPEIGFLVSDNEIAHPMLTSWRVLAVLPWHEKRIRQALRALDVGPVDIRRRGLAGDVPAITKRLRGSGHRRVIIAMTRAAGEPTAIICAHDPA